jgi:hypothetical protein
VFHSQQIGIALIQTQIDIMGQIKLGIFDLERQDRERERFAHERGEGGGKERRQAKRAEKKTSKEKTDEPSFWREKNPEGTGVTDKQEGFDLNEIIVKSNDEAEDEGPRYKPQGNLTAVPIGTHTAYQTLPPNSPTKEAFWFEESYNTSSNGQQYSELLGAFASDWRSTKIES